MSAKQTPTLSLDLRGEHCPYNAIATLETATVRVMRVPHKTRPSKSRPIWSVPSQ